MRYGSYLNMLCLQSGANWNNGSNAGVWASNWNNTRTNSNNNVGFRADSIPLTPDTHHAILGMRDIASGFMRNRFVTRLLVAKAKTGGVKL